MLPIHWVRTSQCSIEANAAAQHQHRPAANPSIPASPGCSQRPLRGLSSIPMWTLESVYAALAIRRTGSGACNSRTLDADCRTAFAGRGMSSILSGSVGQIFAGAASAQPYSAGNWRTSFRQWSVSQLSMGGCVHHHPGVIGERRGEGVRVWKRRCGFLQMPISSRGTD